MLGVFGLMPGMPLLPFFVLGGRRRLHGASTLKAPEPRGGAAAAAAPAGARARRAERRRAPGAAATAARPAGREDVRKLIEVDVFAIEIGYGLLGLADAKSGGDLLARVTGVRKNLARERGIIVPPISVRDNLELEANDYRFLIRGKAVARGQIMPGRWLAMNVAGSTVKLRGAPTREPVFKLDATWIDEAEKKTAELNGFTVVDAVSVLITHLSETLKSHAHLLLGRQEVQSLIDHLKPAHPALIAELLPDLVNLGIIQRVLQNLLREGLRDPQPAADPRGHRRLRLAVQEPRRPFGAGPPPARHLFRAGIRMPPGRRQGASPSTRASSNGWPARSTARRREIGLALDPATGRHLLEELARRTGRDGPAEPDRRCCVVSPETRLALRRFLEPSFPRLAVLAFQRAPRRDRDRERRASSRCPRTWPAPSRP